MPGYGSIVGTYGYMSPDLYIQKYAKNDVYEDPMLVHNYNLGELKQEGPIAPFMESDQPRKNVESAERLNLRDGGGRVNTNPYLQDGTFTDFEFLKKDPRSMMPGPDMRKYVGQEYDRAKYILKTSDQDNSVPESMLPRQEIYRRLRKSEKYIKNLRHSNYSWSLLGKNQARVNDIDKNNHGMDPSFYQKSMVKSASDDTQIGKKKTFISHDNEIDWAEGADQDFSVELNDQNRKGNQNNDAELNRISTLYSQKTPVTFAQNTSKQLARDIQDIITLKSQSMQNGDLSMYGDSALDANKQRILDSKNATVMAQSILESAGATAHTQLDINNINTKNFVTKNLQKNQRDSQVSIIIVDQLTNANRKLSKQKQSDLRQEIIKSSNIAAESINASNNSRIKPYKIDVTVNRKNVIYNIKKGRELSPHIYTSGVSKTTGKSKHMVRQDNEDHTTTTMKHRSLNTNHQAYTMENVISDVSVFNVKPTYVPQLVNITKENIGNKINLRKKITSDLDVDDVIAEMDSVGKRYSK